MADKHPIQTQGEGIAAQAKAILKKPKEEWPRIASGSASWKQVFTAYALPLAAIGPICEVIGGQLFGYGGFGIYYRPTLMGSISAAITSYIFSIIGLFIVAFLANFLSPKFGGRDDWGQAFKLVAFSMTAVWLAAVFGLVPMLAVLSILGLYSIYLFYTGAASMLGVPDEKAGGYTIVTILAALAVNLVFGAIAAIMVGGAALTGGAMAANGL